MARKNNPFKRKPPAEGRLQKQKQKQSVRQSVNIKIEQPKAPKGIRRRAAPIRQRVAEVGRTTSITNVYGGAPSQGPSIEDIRRIIREDYAEANRRAAADMRERATETQRAEMGASAGFQSGAAAPSAMGADPLRDPTPSYLSIEAMAPAPSGFGAEEPAAAAAAPEEPPSPRKRQRVGENAFEDIRPTSVSTPINFGGGDVARADDNPLSGGGGAKKRGPKTDAEKAAIVGMTVDEYRAMKSTKKAEQNAAAYADLGESASAVAYTPPSRVKSKITERLAAQPEKSENRTSLLEQIASGGKKLRKAKAAVSEAYVGTGPASSLLEQIAGGKGKLKPPPKSTISEATTVRPPAFGRESSTSSTSSLSSVLSRMEQSGPFKERRRVAAEEDAQTLADWE